jgi:glyoxylase-like metal-dependent hydrolase (beta-lactamase superfamily II)
LRNVRRRLALLACAALAGACAGFDTAAALPAPQALAPGVYWLPGREGAADDANLGRIGNAGFVVGDGGVVAIDTGTSHRHGQALLAAIARVTDKPVKVALVTHVRPEFLFGGSAFKERGIPVAMHARSAALMAARCETCLKNLRQTLGEAPMQGSAVYKADRTFDATHELALIGRPLRVLHFGHSSGPGDIALLDVQSGVLFAGGLLDAARVPDIQDSDLEGWKRALAQLHALAPRTVVPGHGPAGEGAAVIAGVQRYLAGLETKVRALLAGGTSLLNIADAAELPEFERWDQYDTIHRRNASVTFLRFEREAIVKESAK